MSEEIKDLIESGEETKAFLREFENELLREVILRNPISPSRETSHKIASWLVNLHSDGKITNKTILFDTLSELHKQAERLLSQGDFYIHSYSMIPRLTSVVHKYNIDEETIDVLMRRLRELPY